jgi:hypothetical protein
MPKTLKRISKQLQIGLLAGVGFPRFKIGLSNVVFYG